MARSTVGGDPWHQESGSGCSTNRILETRIGLTPIDCDQLCGWRGCMAPGRCGSGAPIGPQDDGKRLGVYIAGLRVAAQGSKLVVNDGT